MALDHDTLLRVLYGLVILVLPLAALINRFGRRGRRRPKLLTVHDGASAYEGAYWVEDGLVYVSDGRNQRGTPVGPGGVVPTAEQLLLDIHHGTARRPTPAEEQAPRPLG